MEIVFLIILGADQLRSRLRVGGSEQLFTGFSSGVLGCLLVFDVWEVVLGGSLAALVSVLFERGWEIPFANSVSFIGGTLGATIWVVTYGYTFIDIVAAGVVFEVINFTIMTVVLRRRGYEWSGLFEGWSLMAGLGLIAPVLAWCIAWTVLYYPLLAIVIFLMFALLLRPKYTLFSDGVKFKASWNEPSVLHDSSRTGQYIS